MRRKDYGGIEGATVALYHANDLLQEVTRLAEDEQLDQFPGGYYTPTSDPARVQRIGELLETPTGGAGCRPPPRFGRHAQDENDRTEKGKDSND